MNFITYDMMKLLGWTTVILVSLSILFYLTLALNRIMAKTQSRSKFVSLGKSIVKSILPFARSYHTAFGTVALFTGLSHGYLLLGGFELHSGFLLWTSIVLLGLSGLTMKLIKKGSAYRSIRKGHRLIMFMTVALMIYHVITMF